MQLILVRHGDAGAYTKPDHARNLSDIGKLQAKETAQWLAQHYQPDHFIVSPYNRAQQTLAEISAYYPTVPVSVEPHITPDDDARQAIDRLGDYQGECLLVVCHMNIIAQMASLLTGEPISGFALAEARVFDTVVVAPDLAKEINHFVPQHS